MAAIGFESPAAMPEKLRAASAPRAGYFSLLVQRKVTQRKHAPEPPKPPALLASSGREPNSPSAKYALGSITGSRNHPTEAAMLGGGYGSQRQQQHPGCVRCAHDFVFWFPVPSELAEHRSLSRGCARALFEHESWFSIRASCAAPGLSGGAQRPGVISFGYFSLHKQRKVTRPRRGSRSKAVSIAAGDSKPLLQVIILQLHIVLC